MELQALAKRPRCQHLRQTKNSSIAEALGISGTSYWRL